MRTRKPHVFLIGLFAALLAASYVLVAAFGTTKGSVKPQTDDRTEDAAVSGDDAENSVVAEEDAAITVVTSFYPMYIAAMNLLDGVNGVSLYNLSEPQTGCLHDYQLVPSDMELLSDADIFIINGGGMESFLDDVIKAYPNLTVIDTSGAIAWNEAIHNTDAHDDADDTDEHDADGEGIADARDDAGDTDEHDDHDHEVNAHFWLSVPLYRMQVEAMTDGLAAYLNTDKEKQTTLRPDEKARSAMMTAISDNSSSYLAKIDELIAREDALRQRLQGLKTITFFDGFAYALMDYRLSAVYSLDLDEERQISAGEVAQVVSAVQNAGDNKPVILAEERYGAELAETVRKETGATVIYLDPIVRGDAASGDGGSAYDKDSYITRMGKNMDLLEEVKER